ncbi:MAG: pilus assembly protein [Candidatus Dormibacteraeota bacterium]|nr:pilus assembly protein [Candidatus Dormibacteraeota bacterium]
MNCRHRGQSLAELALALPVILILGLGIADIGRGYYYREAVANAARQAMRIAVLQPQQATGDTACAGGGASATSTTTLPPASANPLATIGNEASLESTSTGTPAGTSISGATMTVTWHCASNLALTNTTATSTDPTNTGAAAIEITINYPMPLITPFLGNFVASPLPIKADLYARAQY